MLRFLGVLSQPHGVSPKNRRGHIAAAPVR